MLFLFLLGLGFFNGQNFKNISEFFSLGALNMDSRSVEGKGSKGTEDTTYLGFCRSHTWPVYTLSKSEKVLFLLWKAIYKNFKGIRFFIEH